MRHLDLFSGVGGFALAARWAGISTVGFCEIDPECRRVLAKHWPRVPAHEDIRTLNGELYAGIDIITGGYPCQPFSVAGSQKAGEDVRHLWPEMRRIVAQAKPTWVICENVFGHIALGLDEVLSDLEHLGYASQPFVVPSVAGGAPHRRERVYIVAHTAGHGRDGGEKSRSARTSDVGRAERQDNSGNDERRGGLRLKVDRHGEAIGSRGIEPPALRVDAKLPRRVDRNRMIGNAIDPVIAYQLFQCILRCNY